jgi:RNA polymerase sigma factor FliA
MRNRRTPRCPPGMAAPSKEALILGNLHLVRAIAANIRVKIPVHIETEDLIHDGLCGLVDAAKRYDVARRVPFVLYAKHRIRGAILDGLRLMDPVSRDLRAKAKRVEMAIHDLGNRLGRTPTAAEVAEETGIGVHDLRRLFASRAATGTAPGGNEQAVTSIWDLTADETSNTEAIATREELRKALIAGMAPLPRRDRQIVMLYHWRCASMREIGSRFGINESRVSQIHKRALERMAAALRSAGITSSSSILLR